MNDKETESLQDDLNVEITDLDSAQDGHHSPARVGYPGLLSRRRRVPLTIVTVVLIFFAILVIVISTPEVRQLLVQRLPTAGPSRSTPLYYQLEANPPWGRLFVDGTQATLLSAGNSTLVYLTPGQHQLLWRAAPFVDQRCIFTVPAGSGRDTCNHPEFLMPSNPPSTPISAGPGAIIRFPATLNQLPANQRAALIQAAQSAFDSIDPRQLTETVHPGENYAFVPDGLDATRRECKVLTAAVLCYKQAAQAMNAVLHFQLDTDTTHAAPCAPGACSANGEDCRLFCDASAFEGMQYPVGPQGWHAFATVHLFWQYTPLDGSSPGAAQPDTFIKGSQNEHFVPLVINWSDGKWQVSLLFPNPITPYGELQCDFAGGEVYSLLTSRSTQNYSFTYQLPGTMAAGCLIEIDTLPTTSDQPGSGPTPSSTPPAFFLHRFGVLLAANNEAARLAPYLPLVDAYERELIRSITG